MEAVNKASGTFDSALMIAACLLGLGFILAPYTGNRASPPTSEESAGQ
jgi:hypothetical protein